MTRGHNVSFKTDLKDFPEEVKKEILHIHNLYSLKRSTSPSHTSPSSRTEFSAKMHRFALIQFELPARKCTVGTFNDRVQ